MDYLMGIDLGSTSLKAIVYDLDGNAVAQGSRPMEKHVPDDHPEWTVWLPEHIWNDTAAAIAEATAALDNPADIKGVAVTGMGMDGVPMDADGNWLYPFISWHDTRTEPQLKWWKEHVGIEKYAINGNPVWPINSALRMLWMQEHEPAIMEKTRTWLLIEDFLNYMLCGARTTDFSMASCTMFLDQNTRAWSEEIIAASGINGDILPEPRQSGTQIGAVTEEAAAATGLAAGTPVILGGHDLLCGTLPVGAFEPGAALDVTGTWECIIFSKKEPVMNDALRDMGMTVQASVARDRHAIWGAAPAAEMLEWFRKEFGAAAKQRAAAAGGEEWDYLLAAAAAAEPGAGGVFFLPHMSASACPVQDEKSRGAFVGLGTRAGFNEMLRAVIEGLNYQFLDIVNAAESSLETSVDKVIAVGGGTKSALGMQNKADIINRPIEVPGIEEATPLGAAILAGIGVGLYDSEQEAFKRVYREGTTYEPDPDRAAKFKERFAIYKDLYPALKPVNHRIAGL